MPTYQSSPNYSPVFPDEEAHKNPYGFRTLKGNTILIRGEIDPAHSAHPEWKKQANEVVLARVHNTSLAKQKMMHQPASRKGLHGYTTYRGNFNSVHGGSAKTEKGEKMVQDLVRDRKFQYDALRESNFESIPQNRLQVNLPPSDTYKLDNLFLSILSNLTAGNVKSLYSEVGSLISELMTSAEKLPESKIGDYQEYVNQIIEALNVLGIEEYGLIGQKYTSELHNIGLRIKRLSDFLKKLAELRGRPTKEKALVLQSMRYSLLADAQKDLQEGALGLYPGIHEARIEREMLEEPRVGRPPEAARRRAREEEQRRVNALERNIGRTPQFTRRLDIEEL